MAGYTDLVCRHCNFTFWGDEGKQVCPQCGQVGMVRQPTCCNNNVDPLVGYCKICGKLGYYPLTYKGESSWRRANEVWSKRSFGWAAIALSGTLTILYLAISSYSSQRIPAIETGICLIILCNILIYSTWRWAAPKRVKIERELSRLLPLRKVGLSKEGAEKLENTIAKLLETYRKLTYRDEAVELSKFLKPSKALLPTENKSADPAADYLRASCATAPEEENRITPSA